MRRSVLLIVFVGSLFACQFVLPYEYGYGATQATEDIAQPMIEALATYKGDFGEYPLSLDDLVPNYLDEIPETSKGHVFTYWQAEFDGSEWYSLCYRWKHNAWACYIPRLDMWDYAPSDAGGV